MEGLKSGWGVGPTPMVLKGLKSVISLIIIKVVKDVVNIINNA